MLKSASAAAVYGLGKQALQINGQFSSVYAQSDPDVVVAKGTDADSAEAILKSALEGLGGIGRFVKPGQVVAIKPNATWAFPPNTASSTDPDLLAALVNLVREAGAKKIIVMDHCSIDPGASEALRVSGIGKMVDKLGVEKLFLDRFAFPPTSVTSIPLVKGKSFQKVGVIKAAIEADVRINLAVAKSHSVTKMTMTMKHMMGFLEQPGLLHARLEQGIADLNTDSPIKADLHILEAIRVRLPLGDYRVCAGPETDKSHPAIVKRVNQIVAGIDPVLIDSWGCIHYYAVKPRELAHVKFGAEMGIGEMDVDKATADGRLQIFNVGDQRAIPTVKPSATPMVTATPTTQSQTNIGDRTATPLVRSTSTPLPTAQPVPNDSGAPEISGAGAGACNDVTDIRPFLNTALIPAAFVIAGLGGILARRGSEKSDTDSPEKE